MSVFLSLRTARTLCTTTTTTVAGTGTAAASSLQKQQHILERVKQERDPEKLYLLFKANTHNRVLLENRFAYQDAVSRLAGARRFDLVERLLEDQATLPHCRRRQAFLARLILLYGHAGMPDHALRAFRRLPSPPPTKSFNATLTALALCRRFDDLLMFFYEVPSSLGLSPDLFSYNILIKALCDMGALDSAFLLLADMEKHAELSPDVVSYTTLLSAFYKSGNGKMADAIWNRMVIKGVRPNVATFNVRIQYLINRRKNWQARNMMRKMVSMGLRPDDATYNLIIKGFCVVGNLEMAKKYFFGMANFGYKPNSRIYQTMIHYLCGEGGELGLAFTLCKESMARNWFPNVNTIYKLLDGLASDPENGERVKEIIEMVRKRAPSYSVQELKAFQTYLTRYGAK
ncbi:pentatricopeptide repeat-containing protein At1g80150, mitochondrial [Nymphaea colorata]|nr:pentatricopeptide repeat-containing protein At1g80150, mitochondrial [Nymphaea colorata]XP_031498761.1 pentatricopeptide repeat-containing protein At1g80150, mitochondrial [Nymphaea colorata]XP_031498765.1 pentatricopeptide repeat-containing protein At1g80150, mitochondrial [Nymphaea colorata]XP_049936271.1 pentatricopeptide repeat-containing protein At1g80150, mitochondrial [Nymphaea colorata]